MTLFDLPPRLKAVDQTRIYTRGLGGSEPWWSVKCLDCNKWITKFDFSADEAMRFAEAAGHRCSPS